MNNRQYISEALEASIIKAKANTEGAHASYIPELGNVDPELLSASIILSDGFTISHGNEVDYHFTLQSVSKVVLLIGMLEELGAEKVFSWVKAEPSGRSFASVGHLYDHGPKPSNPLVNSGAICLSSKIPGNTELRILWIAKWIKKLFPSELKFSDSVYKSEFNSANINRSLTNLMKSTGVVSGDVDEILKPYFNLCSYMVTVEQAAYLPMLLANKGVSPSGERIISEETCNQVMAIMATCGLYNESGMHLVQTGLPAKSGVSGLIIAVVPGKGGVATFSPRVNDQGTSIRGHLIIKDLAQELDWHFASNSPTTSSQAIA